MMTAEEKERLLTETKKLVQFDDNADSQNLKALGEKLKPCADGLVAFFDGHLKQMEATNKIMEAEPGRWERQEKALRQWYEDLFSGDYGTDYYDKILHIGYFHSSHKIDQRYVTAMFNIIFNYTLDKIAENYPDSAERKKYQDSFAKILALNSTLMTETYLDGLVTAAGWSMELLKNMAAAADKSE